MTAKYREAGKYVQQLSEGSGWLTIATVYQWGDTQAAALTAHQRARDIAHALNNNEAATDEVRKLTAQIETLQKKIRRKNLRIDSLGREKGSLLGEVESLQARLKRREQELVDAARQIALRDEALAAYEEAARQRYVENDGKLVGEAPQDEEDDECFTCGQLSGHSTYCPEHLANNKPPKDEKGEEIERLRELLQSSRETTQRLHNRVAVLEAANRRLYLAKFEDRKGEGFLSGGSDEGSDERRND